jgi:hypothetical protein
MAKLKINLIQLFKTIINFFNSLFFKKNDELNFDHSEEKQYINKRYIKYLNIKKSYKKVPAIMSSYV